MLRHQSSSRPGFTLIELLVVVAIVGALIGIMTPSLARARTRTRKVACGATLHGVSTTVKTYLSQNGERYPAAAEMPSINVTLQALPAALQPLAPTPPTAWRCPADHNGYTRSSDGRAFDSYFDGETLSYEYNMALGGQRVEQNFLFPLLGVTRILVAGDFDNVHAPQGNSAAKNLLFVDGHVGSIDDVGAGIGP